MLDVRRGYKRFGMLLLLVASTLLLSMRHERRDPTTIRELLVGLSPSVPIERAAEFLDPFDLEVLRPIPQIGVLHVRIRSGSPLAVAERLQRLPEVRYAVLNAPLHPAYVPNDELYREEYHHRVIETPVAWDTTTGDRDVVVAVLDSGIDGNHEDLRGQFWTNPGEIAGNGRDDDGNGYVDDVAGWDFVSNDGDPFGMDLHGTFSAGGIGAVGDNRKGIAGMAWKISLMPLKIYNEGGSGFLDQAVRAILYAAENGADVINCSWEFSSAYPPLEDAVAFADDRGALVVAAAGNEGYDIDVCERYPASLPLPNVVAVAATEEDDTLSDFSNYGFHSVHVAAPGRWILSTVPGDGYEKHSGTSISAPLVSGLAALILAVRPTLSHHEVKSILMSTVTKTAELEAKTISGGRIDAARAIEKALDPGMLVSPPMVHLEVHDEIRLEASRGLSPYTFTSSDTGVAQVNANGTVRATGNGHAVVTVTDRRGTEVEVPVEVADSARTCEPTGCGASRSRFP